MTHRTLSFEDGGEADGYSIHGSQDVEYLLAHNDFEFYIDYYSDDAEPIRLRDAVKISVDEKTQEETSGKDPYYFIKGSVIEGPAGLLGRECVIALSFSTYRGVSVFKIEENDELSTEDTTSESAGDQEA